MAAETFSCSDWLTSTCCGEYINTFQSNNYFTKERVSSLAEEQLKRWGVSTSHEFGLPSDCERILNAAKRLRRQTEDEAVQEYLVSSMYTS